jgi:hypothetical protein
MAALVLAAIGTGSACTTSTDPAAGRERSSASGSTGPSQSPHATRTPAATVLWSGRIAYPHITLTTWGKCPFIIERVHRVEVGVLRVVGREASTGCEEQSTRHSVTHRLTRKLRAGPGFEKQIIVESEQPEYRVDAHVRRVIA